MLSLCAIVCVLALIFLLQFICTQKWDIMFLQELTSEFVLTRLRDTLNKNQLVLKERDHHLDYTYVNV